MQAPKAKEVLCPGKMAGWLKEQLEVFWDVDQSDPYFFLGGSKLTCKYMVISKGFSCIRAFECEI